jgi:hypothetical protein
MRWDTTGARVQPRLKQSRRAWSGSTAVFTVLKQIPECRELVDIRAALDWSRFVVDASIPA